MPGRDGTGPNGTYKDCVPQESYQRGQRIDRSRENETGGLEKEVGTGRGPCGNGIPRGAGRGQGRGNYQGRGSGRGYNRR